MAFKKRENSLLSVELIKQKVNFGEIWPLERSQKLLESPATLKSPISDVNCQMKVQAFENDFRDFLDTFITKIHFLLDDSKGQRPFSRFSKPKSPKESPRISKKCRLAVEGSVFKV